MNKCPNCNHSLKRYPDEIQHCPMCGAKLSEALIPDKDGFVFKKNGDNVSLVKYVGNASHITIPQGVHIIEEGAFYRGKSIESIDIGNDVVEMKRAAIRDCPNIKKVRIGKGVKKYDDSIWNALELEGIFYDGNIEDWCAFDFEMGGREIKILFPDESGDHTFGDKKYSFIKHAVIPDHITRIKATFRGFIDLESIEFPNRLEEIGRALCFHSDNLRSVKLPAYCSRIRDDAFYCCRKIESIRLPEDLTEVERESFARCDSLQTVYIPSTVERIDRSAFTGCKKITTVIYNGTKAMWEKVQNRSIAIAKANVVFSK